MLSHALISEGSGWRCQRCGALFASIDAGEGSCPGVRVECPTAGQPGEAKMREAFEAWFWKKYGVKLTITIQQTGHPFYISARANAAWSAWQAAATPPGAAGQAVGELTFDERTAVGIAKESARYTRWFIDVAHGGARGSKICQDADSILALIAIIDRLIARHAAPLPEPAAVEKMARAIYEASPSSRKQNGGLRLTWEKMLLQFPEACEMWRTIARAAYAALHGEG